MMDINTKDALIAALFECAELRREVENALHTYCERLADEVGRLESELTETVREFDRRRAAWVVEDERHHCECTWSESHDVTGLCAAHGAFVAPPEPKP